MKITHRQLSPSGTCTTYTSRQRGTAQWLGGCDWHTLAFLSLSLPARLDWATPLLEQVCCLLSKVALHVAVGVSVLSVVFSDSQKNEEEGNCEADLVTCLNELSALYQQQVCVCVSVGGVHLILMLYMLPIV